MRPRSLAALAGAAILATALVVPGGALAQSGVRRSRLPRGWHSEAGQPIQTRAHPGRGSTIECAISPGDVENVLLDCPGNLFPTRESAIAVDPTDNEHMVAAAEDGDFGDQDIGFATTFDGGKTWTIGDIPHGPNLSNFDAWVTFDIKHRVVILSYQDLGANENLCPPPGAQYVTISTDGGLTWADPVTIQKHRGCYPVDPNEAILYESKVATDNDPSSPYYGRTWLTGGWIGAKNGDYTFPIVETHSDDGGYTWTKIQVISGSNATYCTGSPHPPRCDNGFPPLAVLGPDGTLYVEYVDESNAPVWEPNECCEDQLLLVSSKDGGVTWSQPRHIVDLEDGIATGPDDTYGDYDCAEGSVYGCVFTGIALQEYEPASQLAIGLDGMLYVAFADNRNGLHDVEHPVSNNDVFLMSSSDGGQTWTGPDVVSDAPGDQWRPALAVNPVSGELGILFYDRREDPTGKTMSVTLATGLPGEFDFETITTAPSHLSGDLWLSENLPNCKHCVYHVGEYLGLAYDSEGTAHMTWADLRKFETLPNGRKGYTTNIDYAKRGYGRAAS